MGFEDGLLFIFNIFAYILTSLGNCYVFGSVSFLDLSFALIILGVVINAFLHKSE